jgi:DNA-binding winged helix-turn-helix (wHTH) protein
VIYSFRGFDLDAERCQLRRGGVDVPVQRKVLELLLLLASKPDLVVSRHELERSLWAGMRVGPSSLRRLVALARRALGDEDAIRTVRGIGYRLVAEPMGRDGEDAPSVAPALPFVGRERSLLSLGDRLAEVIAGRARCVLVEGPPGIGKTRLIEVFVESPVARAARVMWGRCSEDIHAPSFWPWRQVFAESPKLEQLMRSGASPERTANADGEDRFLLFARIAEELKAMSVEQPLIMALDDLHRADQASLALLRFLIREASGLRTLFVCALRDSDEASRAGRDLVQEALADASEVSSLPLAGLSRDEVRAFLERARYEATTRSLLEIEKLTAGNPFWLSAVVQTQGGESIDELGTSGLRQIIPRALRTMSENARHLIEVASVAGRRFEPRIAARAAEISEDETSGLLTQAEQSHLIEPEPEPDPTAARRFRHVLLCQAIAQALSTRERQRIHGRIADALEAIHGEKNLSYAAELAYHRVRSGDGTRRAIECWMLAAEHDRRSLAWENAPTHLLAALEVAERHHADDLRLKCELQISLGEAWMRAGDPGRAEPLLHEAAALARSLDELELFVRAALALSPDFFGIEIGAFDVERTEMLREALRKSEANDLALRSRILCALAIAYSWSDARGQMEGLEHEIESLAATELNEIPRLNADCARYALLTDPWERARLGRSIVDRALALREHDLALIHRVQLVSDHLETGDLDALEAEVSAFERQALRSKRNQVLWYVHLFAAMRALNRGRLAEEASRAEEVARTGYPAGDRNALQSFGGHVVFVSTFRDEFARIQGHLNEMLASVNYLAVWYAGRAWAWCMAGEAESGRADYERYASHDFENIANDRLRLATVGLLCEPALAYGDRRGASLLYEELLPHARLNLQIGFACICLGSASRYLGVAARAIGDYETAERHFEDALRDNLRVDAPLWAAATLRDHAEMLAARADGEDVVRAAELARDGLRLLRRESVPLLERQLVQIDSLAD